MRKALNDPKISISDRSKTLDSNPYERDISILMTSFLMKIVGLWLAKNRAEQRQRHLTLVYTVIAVLFGVWIETRDFYYSWPNFSDCAYVACNVLCLTMVLLKLFVVFVNRKKFIELLLYTHKQFWHTNYDPTEKIMIINCKRVCTVSLVLINFCVQATIVSYVIAPIVENIGSNQTDRILPFRMWINFPIYESPYFEMMFVTQVLALYHIGVCYICFDNLLCLMNLHTATQFRILQYRLKNLGGTDTQKVIENTSSVNLSDYTEKCYSRFKCYVQQHEAHIQYCNRLERIFNIIVLAHILLFSFLMCLVGYQIFLAESSKTRRLIFVFNILANLCSLLLFTSSCDGLIEESLNIGTAIYSGPWINLPMNKMGRKLRKDLNMVILRSRKPCCLTACGFFPVSLETCTTVLSTAMSYFTLMRQFTFNSALTDRFLARTDHPDGRLKYRHPKFAMSSEQSRNLSLIATSFYMKVVGIWPAKNKVEERWRKIAFIYSVWAVSFSFAVQTTDAYHSMDDFAVLTLYHIGVCYLCLDNFLCVLNLHVASQFRILQYRIENLVSVKGETKLKEASFENRLYQEDECLKTFKMYVKQHQTLIEYCNRLQEVFSTVGLGQVIIFSLLICLDGYLVLLEAASLRRRLIFAFHITGCMCQLLMFTYSCDCLIQESSQIAAAVYATPWTQLSMNKDGSALRKDLILVMMKSRVPCCLSASGFFDVSLETYTTVLSTAASYFTLLRQY
ncbi:uncharacterized protein LOC143346056 [Colletes latitarsis]|uniref:uncharacterized protein LOC143346056 n=1 Tax=Colletes latitarsis TaxID=2605962 RepID=UPI0040362D33